MFDQILMPDPEKYRGRFLEGGGIGSLLVAPTSYTPVAKTSNQRNVAAALDRYISAHVDDRETVSIALDRQSAEQYPYAFDQISPAFYESLAGITIEQVNMQNQNLAQRASALRLGARGFQTMGIETPLAHDKDGRGVMNPKDGKDILSHAPDNRWGAWVQGNGNFARITTISQVPDYNFESGGFLAGVDYRWSENFVTGLYGGYSAYTVRRPINFSTIDRTARSRPDGGQFTTSLDLGYDWKLGHFTVGPILSGQYTYAGIAPFSESGADSLDLSVAQQNANSLRTSLGGRIAYTWRVNEKFTLIPEARMFWQHEFLENPRCRVCGRRGDWTVRSALECVFLLQRGLWPPRLHQPCHQHRAELQILIRSGLTSRQTASRRCRWRREGVSCGRLSSLLSTGSK